MPNFGLTTIVEYKPTEETLVLRFSERQEIEYYTARDGSRGEIKVLIVQAEQLENDGFGHYLPTVEIHSYADKRTELQGTVPAEYVRRDIYTKLIQDILRRTGF